SRVIHTRLGSILFRGQTVRLLQRNWTSRRKLGRIGPRTVENDLRSSPTEEPVEHEGEGDGCRCLSRGEISVARVGAVVQAKERSHRRFSSLGPTSSGSKKRWKACPGEEQSLRRQA